MRSAGWGRICVTRRQSFVGWLTRYTGNVVFYPLALISSMIHVYHTCGPHILDDAGMTYMRRLLNRVDMYAAGDVEADVYASGLRFCRWGNVRICVASSGMLSFLSQLTCTCSPSWDDVYASGWWRGGTYMRQARACFSKAGKDTYMRPLTDMGKFMRRQIHT